MYSVDEILSVAADRVDSGRRVALCLLVRTKGSTPASAGALMAVDDAAEIWGTIGGGCVEAEVRRQALELVNKGESGLLHFQLDHDYGWDDGLICGGQIHVAVAPATDAAALRHIADAHRNRQVTELRLTVNTETGAETYALDLPPRPRLFIAGAGHIGQALTGLADDLGFETHVFDDREDLLKRFIPESALRVTGPIAETIASAGIDENTFIVIVTRGHRHDEEVLRAVIDQSARYIGMIGSRRKVKLVFDDLVEMGVAAEALEKVHAPIGIDIHSVTVHEIALSIAAQLVAERRCEYAAPVRGPLPSE